ncbi:Prolyl 4-hydroxylase subunit alpha-2 [Nymphon striatum]|nr:Prolyl 4-hydroxylase subunit alpha-2 [Nymphon striatum]
MKYFFAFIYIIPLVCSELFTSLSDLENLLNTEEELINVMTNYIQAEELKLKKLKSVLSDFNAKHLVANVDASSYVANPINSYLLVKRLSTDWGEIQNLITDNENKDSIVNMTNNRGDLVFPDIEDLHGAAMALIRLQETYKLDAANLSVGHIDGAKPSLSLTANDCFELGRQSYVNKDYKHTVDWMDEAMKKYTGEDPKTISIADILEYLAFSHYMLGHLEEGLKLTKELIKADPAHPRAPGNIRYYEDLIEKDKKRKMGEQGIKINIPNEVIDEPNPIPEREQYEKLCRGEKLMTIKEESQLKCQWFQCNHPYCILVRFKEEETYLDPRIVRYHNVLSDYEIKVIQSLASPKLKRATVQHHETGELITASYRISKSAWLKGDDHKVVAGMNNKVQLLSALTVKTAEDLQVANYGLGGHYEPHYDFAREEEIKAFESLGVGNRIATMLFYMSDIEAGGSTVFTKLGVSVRPIKGSAVFWFNLFKSGKGDLRTRHAACPVLAGNKWVCNKWLHEYGQELLYPCGMNRNE